MLSRSATRLLGLRSSFVPSSPFLSVYFNDWKPNYFIPLRWYSKKKNEISKLIKLAEEGCTDSQYALGMNYIEGSGVAKDVEKGRVLLESAADKGKKPEAFYKLGCLHYETGLLENALDEFLDAADLGYAKGQYAAGCIYVTEKFLDYSKAFHYFKLAADQGHVESQVNLGQLFANGWGKEQNIERARETFHSVAAQGHPDGYYNLAKLENESGNFKKAVEYLKLAADGGSVDAEYEMGIFYATEPGDVLENHQLAFEYLSKAAEKDHDEAQYDVSHYYLNGILFPVNEEKAIELLKKAVKKNNREAMYVLGELHTKKESSFFNVNKALKYYKQAADLGHVGAASYLGDYYSYVNSDYKTGITYWQAAADLGDQHSQLMLALAYFEGNGVAKNVHLAFKTTQALAEEGYSEAKFYLAAWCMQGTGTKIDYKRGIDLFTELAETENHTVALYNLGVCYSNGNGVERDVDKAIGFFSKAAANGDVKSEFNAGLLYFEKVPPDIAGLDYIKSAADKGYGKACYFLSKCYEDGRLLEKDDEKAAYYANVASAKGVTTLEDEKK